MRKSFKANGKLLLSGEYFILDGAIGLALPCKLGQRMTVEQLEAKDQVLHWQSFDVEGNCWFKGDFNLYDFSSLDATDENIAKRLSSILIQCRRQRSNFLKQNFNLAVNTHLEFQKDWGLGSSSTLLAMVAQWAEVDPYKLLENTFGGSGYDIACASQSEPLVYQLKENKAAIETVWFSPSFSEQLYFVFLGKKQNSREGIARYRSVAQEEKDDIRPLISQITHDIIKAQDDFYNFEHLIDQHERLVAKTLKIERVSELYFNDFWGQTKSLGAWGGDFILASSNKGKQETVDYFKQKGFDTIIPYKEMVN